MMGCSDTTSPFPHHCSLGAAACYLLLLLTRALLMPSLFHSVRVGESEHCGVWWQPRLCHHLRAICGWREHALAHDVASIVAAVPQGDCAICASLLAGALSVRSKRSLRVLHQRHAMPPHPKVGKAGLPAHAKLARGDCGAAQSAGQNLLDQAAVYV